MPFQSRLFAGLSAALVVAACGELPPAPLPVASVTVSPATPSILVGTAVQLSASAKDAQGNTLRGRAIAWSSSAEAVATVDATGLVTGVSAGGPVTITATSEGHLGTAQVEVTAPPLPGYTLSPSASTFSIAQGQDPFPVTTVDLVRSNFTGNVTLSVDNLPTGVEAFTPTGGTPGSSSYVVLAVAGNALPGTYTNLLLRGVASGLADRTAPLTLTITVAPFLLTLSSATLSMVQGTATPTTTVNLVRNDFAGPVTLYLRWHGADPHDDGGLPPGVTAAFAPDPVTGNSAVLTLTVGAAVTPGVYSLFVSGGASTGGFCCIPLTLTVTALPPAPGYTLSLSASTLSIAQSAWSPSTEVLLARSNFTGNVSLSVENLPTGVSAYFGSASQTVGNSAELWLFVAGSALPGTYANLLVRGAASGLSDRTVPLTLTITKAPFIITLSSSTLSIAQGASTPTTTVNVVRHSFAGPVSFYLFDDWEAMPPGLTAAFSPNPTTGDNTVLTISVAAATVPGVYRMWVLGEATAGWFAQVLTLTVTPASP